MGLFGVAEVLNLSFYLFPFAIGAAGAALVSLAGGGAVLARITSLCGRTMDCPPPSSPSSWRFSWFTAMRPMVRAGNFYIPMPRRRVDLCELILAS